MSEIKFGTDGWRAVVGKDFTYENTDKVINSVAIYIYKEAVFAKKILIGYDPRNKADEFAKYIAEKLSAFGFDVELSEKIVATPVLAYSALHKNAYALMLTASHNPPEYLGIKFIPPYGGPAEDFMVKEIMVNLEEKFTRTTTPKHYKLVSFDEDYVEHIKHLINFDVIKNSGVKINYDGHHGAASKLFVKILENYKIQYNAINLERDINFGGQMPDPKEKYLPELKKLCIQNKLIGLSNDGDGDRFGVFDETGSFISANDIIAMLLKHLVTNKNYTGKLAKTVGASCMLDLYAQKYGIETIETPVGFKWLGAAMRNEDVIIAGEESGGLSIKGHIPEKDGIIANLLIMEMMATENKTLNELHTLFLNQFDRKFYTDRVDIKLEKEEEKDILINKFKEYETIFDYKIVRKNTSDGLKLYLEEGSSVLIRKSGTEPLLRVYFESDKEEKMQKFEKEIKQLCCI